jgi:hypothetical protein
MENKDIIMNKKVITIVSCDNEFMSDVPGSVIIEITEDTAKEILRLAEVVNENDVYKVEKFDYSPKFCSYSSDLDDMVNSNAPKSFEELEKAIHETETYLTECDTLCVHGGQFKWTAYPKHAGADCRLSTQMIPLDFLTNDEETLILV